MVVLYLGSGRYYVEHLLFFVHFHAFFFLSGIAILVLERFIDACGHTCRIGPEDGGEHPDRCPRVLRAVLPVPGDAPGLRAGARRHALVKYSLLLIGYLVFMTLTVLGLLAYTALTL